MKQLSTMYEEIEDLEFCLSLPELNEIGKDKVKTTLANKLNTFDCLNIGTPEEITCYWEV